MFFLLFLYPRINFLNFGLKFIRKNLLVCLDFFSFLILILTFWIVFLRIISSLKINSLDSSITFIITFVSLFIILFIFFVVNNLIFFFFFFESSLIPTLFIIIGWGNKVERIKSGYYLFFYTLFGSIPILLRIFFLEDYNISLRFFFIEINSFSLIYLFLIFSFLIKIPIFLVHSWLPKAHVEAPLSGSIILAGVLLKMGGYGIFRFFFIYKNFLNFNLFWIYIRIWGGILSRIICLRQIDLKSIVAYSSVSHMSLVIIGLLTFSFSSIIGSLILMVAHGLCSSALFFLVNVLYERSGSRRIFLNKGLMSIFPSLSIWWFLFCSFNIACPPSLNLIREIFLINGLISWSFLFVVFLIILSFLGGVYNLFLFSFCNHGYLNSNIFFFNSCYLMEYLILYIHFFPIFFFFLKLDVFY